MFTCVDPDTYSEYGSGSRKFLNTDPSWIRIHNTGGQPDKLQYTVCDF